MRPSCFILTRNVLLSNAIGLERRYFYYRRSSTACPHISQYRHQFLDATYFVPFKETSIGQLARRFSEMTNEKPRMPPTSASFTRSAPIKERTKIFKKGSRKNKCIIDRRCPPDKDRPCSCPLGTNSPPPCLVPCSELGGTIELGPNHVGVSLPLRPTGAMHGVRARLRLLGRLHLSTSVALRLAANGALSKRACARDRRLLALGLLARREKEEAKNGKPRLYGEKLLERRTRESAGM